MAGIRHVDLPIKNVWLADLLARQRDLVTDCWIQDIRATNIHGYETITDERLRAELPPTVDSMIYAFRTGDTQGPREHALEVIRHRLADGFQLPDLQTSLHALETAVMRIVKTAGLGPVQEYQALQSASNMYFMVALIAATVYEQLRAAQQSRFIKAYEFGTTLSRELDLGAVLDTSVSRVAEYTGAESVAILLADSEDGRGNVRAHYNLDVDLVEVLPDFCRPLDCSVVDTENSDVRKTTSVIADVRADNHLEMWSELLVSHGRLSMLCAPLVAKQRRLGSLILLWAEVHSVSAAEMDFLLAMAGHIANAIQNAILYQDAKGKQELGILLDASKLFGSTLDTQDILRSIARMATEAIRADLAIVFTQDHMPDRSHSAYHIRNRRAAGAFRRIMDAVVSEGEESGFSSLGREFASGKAMLYRDCSEFPGRMRSLTGIGASGIVVPLRQNESLLGAFAVVSMVPNAFTEDDVLLATGMADLAGVAIENARLYEYERNIAETLQRSFLPASVPSIDGYEIATYYRPAMAEAEIGGDFYDVFAAGEDHVSVVIGDVSGKGLRSAIPTVMGKYLVRAYSSENLPPGAVMAKFNKAFIESAPEGLFMTAFHGSLDPRHHVFTYSSAGHDPPLLYREADRQVEQVDIGGICLGVTSDAEYMDNTIQLQPGDVLLLYTDGATDVKGDDSRLGVEGLERLLLNNAHESAQEIMRSVSDGIWDYAGGRLADDVALVVIKRLKDSLS